MHSWRILLLPFVDFAPLYDEYRFDEPWNGPNNRKLADRMPEIYALHGCAKSGNVTTNYLRVVGRKTASPPDRILREEDIPDGASATLFIVENVDAGVHWMEPRDLSFDSMNFQIGQPNGVSSWLDPPAGLTAGGDIQKLPTDTPPEIVKDWFTIADGNKKAYQYFNKIADGRLRPKTRNAPCGYSLLEKNSSRGGE